MALLISIARCRGEDGENTTLSAACVLSNPWDFFAGHVELEKTYLGLIYSRAMAANLRGVLKRHLDQFKDDKRIWPEFIYGNPRQTLYQFDSQA